MRPKLLIALLLILPVSLFFIARETASWRPKLIGGMPAIEGAISPDEKWFACIDKFGTNLQVLDLDSRKIERTIPIPRKGVGERENLQWTPDSTKIAVSWYAAISPTGKTSNKDYIGVLVYELGGKTKVFEDKIVPLADNPSVQIHFLLDEKMLWLASPANYRAWNWQNGKLVRRYTNSDGNNSSALNFGALSTDCRTFFHVDKTGFQKSDTLTKKQLSTPQYMPNLADIDMKFRFSPDSTLLFYQNSNNNSVPLQIIETNRGQLLWKPSHWPLFSPDSKFCLLKFPDRIEKRDARTGKLQGRFPPVAKNVELLQIMGDKMFYSIDDMGNLYRSRLK